MTIAAMAGSGRLEGADPGVMGACVLDQAAAAAPWHVLWTRSNCEPAVRDQLLAWGFSPFLPVVDAWSRRAGVRHRLSVPLFPGYLFLHDRLDKARHTEVRKARGLVRILGERWDRPAVVPEEEIEAIRAVVGSRLPVSPHPYLRAGRRVRIVQGPLSGVEGILLRTRAERGLLVLSVNLLQRSVAVEVDCTHVEPV